MRQCSNVDGRCDGARDECQGSERGNKPLRLGVTLVSQPRALCRTQSTSEMIGVGCKPFGLEYYEGYFIGV